MAYSGSTAATSVANPPRKLIEGIASNRGTTALTGAPSVPGGQGGAVWAYVSTDAVNTVTGSNYFSDGKDLGMRPGDFVLGGYTSTAGSSVEVYLGIITGVSTAGATLRTGTLASSA